MTTLVPVIFVAFLALIVVVVVVSYLRAKKRREGLAAYAATHGWTYDEQDQTLLDRFEGAPFGNGEDREAFNVLRGTADDRPIVVFDYKYVTTSTTTDSNGHTRTERHTHPFSVMAVNTGVVMPALSVTPEGLVSRFFGRLTNSDIELESEDFNRAFTVTCPNRRFASDVLHPRMMELLLQSPELAWRFDADSLLAIRAGKHDIQEIDAKLAALDAILDNIKASQNFLALQDELTNTEDRIAASRRFYNGNVRAFNTRVRTFPSNLVAAAFGFRAREFFELKEPAPA